ncbi:hypothetical protein UFOVP273_83 [uncultured Caudovirales phage]|uniref:Uncharacterized protein n=1 Tax=uncultured Caudovirales phage TaxID=2100421 RepID=A0A6J5LIR7_9CAUD|nr:hypothetical protein UFOVP273_83 [uncultured Caudovirales phage]
MNKYLITYESAHWCGASDTKCVVEAETPEEAEDRAEWHMSEEMRGLFADEYEDADGEYEDEAPYYVTRIELFTPEHEEWQYYVDEHQSQFYPDVN